MSLAVDIYGTLINLPDKKDFIEDWGTTNPKEQYWRRKELPDFFDEVKKDEDGNAILNEEQSKYAKEEVRRVLGI